MQNELKLKYNLFKTMWTQPHFPIQYQYVEREKFKDF